MRWAQVRELEALGREQREALARDIGIPPEMLPALVARGPDAAAELPRLMQALSLDADEIRKIHAALMRDMSLDLLEGAPTAARPLMHALEDRGAASRTAFLGGQAMPVR